jgi:hypothetical protein
LQKKHLCAIFFHEFRPGHCACGRDEFKLTKENKQMKKLGVFVTAAAMAVLLLTLSARGDFFSPGIPNGWDFNTPMTETFGGSGIWEYTWTGTLDNPTTFDILSEAGNWDSKVHPAGNQWVTPDGSGGNTLILDTNAVGDGWFPDVNRVKVVSESVTTWTAVGDWQNQIGGGDWDNANVNTAMGDLGGGIFGFTATLAPGTYQYKATKTGSWDAIGIDSRNVNSGNLEFTTTASLNQAEMLVNVFDGTVRVNVIPEPATLGLLVGGSLLMMAFRRLRR